MSVEIGTAIGKEVGSSVELFSVGGSKEHSLQLSKELAAAGVTVTNAPKGLFKDFTRAADNDAVYNKPKMVAENDQVYHQPKMEAENDQVYNRPSKAVDFGQKFG